MPRPSVIACLGLNYRSHIEETGREVPRYPTLFAKYARALVGARDGIVMPRVSDQLDWEAELAVVVGRRLRGASEDQAAAAVAGYTVSNDVSVRDWQRRTAEWLSGKTWEGTTPLGPLLVTPDELGGDPGAPDLEISCTVDDREVQRARTGDLIFTPSAVLAYLSTILTLEPGDLVLTGTPGGIGAARDPQEWLREGQHLQTSVEGIGTCHNRVVRDGGAPAGL